MRLTLHLDLRDRLTASDKAVNVLRWLRGIHKVGGLFVSVGRRFVQ